MKNKIILTVFATLIVLMGCKTEKTPNANFEYTQNGLKVVFFNLSTHANSYEWDFGDYTYNSENFDKNPTHYYTSSGTYQVSLTAWNSKGQSSTKSMTIVVQSGGNPSGGGGGQEVSPEASFQYKPDTSMTIKFNNTSKNANSYKWDFGDGTSSTETSPTHTYVSIGVKNVILYAYNNGKTSTATASVNMNSYIKIVSTANDPYYVYIDGVQQTTLNSGAEKAFLVKPGTHIVRLLQKSGYTFYPTDRETTVKCYAGYEHTLNFSGGFFDGSIR